MKGKKFVILVWVLLISVFNIFADSWAGTYLWVNPTDKNNNGKCTEIRFVVKDVLLEDGSLSFEVWDASDESNLRKLFPIDPNEKGEYTWHKWKEDSTEAENYRANAEKFNTTSYTPSKWRVKEIVQGELTGICKVETVAFIFTVNTTSCFTLRYNAQTGVQELVYMTDGDSLASLGLFSNPAPGEDGEKAFVLTKIS